MKANVGFVDMFIRLFVGACLIGLAVAGVIGPWGYVGVVPLATGLLKFCPAYTLLGISTRGKGNEEAH
ncbi:MAG: YgaP family membrane protein [Pseudomonadota bacterium]